MSYQEMRTECENFAKAHIIECANELIEWSRTGLLVDGKVRELARQCAKWTGAKDSLTVAESIVKNEALLLCSRNEP